MTQGAQGADLQQPEIVLPENAVRVAPGPGGSVNLPEGTEVDDITVAGRDLVVQLPDGSYMIIEGGAVFVPQLNIGSVEVLPTTLAALLIGEEPQPAAGDTPSSGGNFGIPVPPLPPGIGLGDLLPPTALFYTPPEYRELGLFENDVPEIVIQTPEVPFGLPNAFAIVDEAGLPANGPLRGDDEPAGTGEDDDGNLTNNSDASEFTGGTFVFSSPDNAIPVVEAGGLTINGVVVIYNENTNPPPEEWQAIQGEYGILYITGGLENGFVTFQYVLSDNTIGAETDNFIVTVTDPDGDSATATLTIQIIDDSPEPEDDVVTLQLGQDEATGNVISGEGSDDGADSADIMGADGFKDWGLVIDGQDVVITGPGSVKTDYGTLFYDAEGEWTYVRDEGGAGGKTEVFEYFVRDGDNSRETATLTIIIPDEGPDVEVPQDNADNPALGAPGTFVFEWGLDAGENGSPGTQAAGNGETTNGTVTFTDGDAPSTFEIDGTPVTAGSIVNGEHGTLEVLSIENGELTYRYTLTENTDGNSTSDSFEITVIDPDDPNDPNDDEKVTKTLTIQIIDDEPIALDDANSIAAGEYGPATGNVIDENDTPGADDGTVTAIASVNVPANESEGEGTLVIQGEYGVLTIEADGDYSYVRDFGTEGGVEDVFTYTLTDGDQDPTTAQLVISIGDDGVTVSIPEPGGDSTTVYEDALPARGEEPAGTDELGGGVNDDPGEFTSGTVTFISKDGLGGISVAGTALVLDGAFPQTVSSDASGVLVITGVSYDAETGIGSFDYEYTLIDNTLTDPDSVSFTVEVSDADGDSNEFAELEIAIIDDAPIAYADTDSINESDLGLATGNVITDADPGDAGDSDDGADNAGADNATVVGVVAGENLNGDGTDLVDTVNGEVGMQLDGLYGTLTLYSDGSYDYDLDNGDPTVTALVDGQEIFDVFTYTIEDGDGDRDSQTLTITIIGDNAGPSVRNVTLSVSEEGLAGGNPDSAGVDDDTNSDMDTADVQGSDPDGDTLTYSIAAPTTGTYYSADGQVITWVQVDPQTVEGRAGGEEGPLVITVSIDSATGVVKADLDAPMYHGTPPSDGDGNIEGQLTIAFGVTATDPDGVEGTSVATVEVEDDSPLAGVKTGEPVPSITLDESLPSEDGLAEDSANFAGNFNIAPVQYGGDGPGTVAYSLVLIDTGDEGIGSGLYALDPSDVDGVLGDGDGVGQGDEIMLVNDGGTIKGMAGGQTYFTITVDNTGEVTFTQLLNIWHSDTGDHDDAEGLVANGGSLVLRQTVTDDDNDSATADLDLSAGVFSIEDDGPDAVADEEAGLDTLTLDESLPSEDGIAEAMADFSDNFDLVIDYGTDGAGSVTYSLVLAAANLGSGLYALDPSDTDAAADDGDGIGQGQEILLNINADGDTITGSAGGTDYFTITIDGTGQVTFTQLENIWHGDPGDDDDSEAIDLVEGSILVRQTVKDADGDSDSDDVDVSSGVFSIEDDGPHAEANPQAALDTLTLDESLPSEDGIVTASAQFADNFNLVIDYGTDGAGSVTYTLVLNGANVGSGLYALDPSDTDALADDGDGIGQGQEILLNINGAGDTITGSAGGVDYFTITVDGSGEVTFTQLENIYHGDPTDPDDGEDIALAAETIQVRQTVTDADGDSHSDEVDLSTGVFSIEDDGPDAEAKDGVDPDTLTLDESPLSEDGINPVSANFADNFVELIDYGTDGEGDVVYSLFLNGSNVGSGLYALDPSDTLGVADDTDGIGQGEEILLNLNADGDTITGSVGGTDYFTIEVDTETGEVTFTQINNIWHGNTGDNDDSEAIDLAANTIEVRQTVIDADGDSDTAAVDLSTGVFSIEDDGPSRTDAELSGTVDEDGLTDGIEGGIGDVVGTNTVLNGSVTSLFDLGTDGAGTYGIDSAVLGASGLTSGGAAITYSLSDSGDTLIAHTGADKNVASAQVFTLQVAANGAYTFTLLGPIDHESLDGLAGDDTENDLVLNLSGAIIAYDADGDSVSASGDDFLVTVDDDTPVEFTADAVASLDGDQPPITADLNLAMGADGLGVDGLEFDIVDNTIATDQEGNQLRLDGQLLYLFGDGTDTLVATTGMNGTGDVGFIVTLNADGTYTFDVEGVITNGTATSFTDLSSTKAGNVSFAAIGADNPANTADNIDVIVSAVNELGGAATVNTNVDQIGADSQAIAPGYVIRLDLVQNAQSGGPAPSGFSFDSYEGTDRFQQEIPQVQGSNNTVAIRVGAVFETVQDQTFSYDLDSLADGNESIQEITSVTIYDYVKAGNGKNFVASYTVEDPGNDTPVSVNGGQYEVTFHDDGTVTIDGLGATDEYAIETSTDFNSVIVEADPANTENFDLGIFTLGRETAGIPIDQDFDVIATDADGDSVTGQVETTIIQQFAGNLVGTNGDDVLTGNGDADSIAGNDGNDQITGFAGSDYLYGGAGDDIIAGGDGNDYIRGGNGNDEVYGGAGGDIFVMSYSSVTDGSVDTIGDYKTSDADIIDLSKLLEVPNGTDLNGGGYVRYLDDGTLQVDVDGGGDNWVTVATVFSSPGVHPASVYVVVESQGSSFVVVNAQPAPMALSMSLSAGQTLVVANDEAEISKSLMMASAVAVGFGLAAMNETMPMQSLQAPETVDADSFSTMSIEAMGGYEATAPDMSALHPEAAFLGEPVSVEAPSVSSGEAAAFGSVEGDLGQPDAGSNSAMVTEQVAFEAPEAPAAFAGGEVVMPGADALAALAAGHAQGVAPELADVLGDALLKGDAGDVLETALAALGEGHTALDQLAMLPANDAASIWGDAQNAGFTADFGANVDMEAMMLQPDAGLANG